MRERGTEIDDNIWLYPLVLNFNWISMTDTKSLHVSNIGFATPTLLQNSSLPISHANLYYFSKLSKENWILFFFFSFIFFNLYFFLSYSYPFRIRTCAFIPMFGPFQSFMQQQQQQHTHTLCFNYFYFTTLSFFYHFISDSNESHKLVFQR